MKIKEQQIISFQIFELRYKAIPELFDKRGSLISFLKKKMKFPHWRISDNKIVLTDNLEEEESREKCFVSHLNCGYSVFKPDTKNYFKDKTIKFMKSLFNSGLVEISDLLRVGLRSKFIIVSGEKFDYLLEKVKSKYLKMELDSDLFDEEIRDIGFPMNFKDGKDLINSQFGAMENEQIKKFFNNKKGLPNRGIYFELDYYRLEEDLEKPYERLIIELINTYNEKEFQKLEKLVDKIF